MTTKCQTQGVKDQHFNALNTGGIMKKLIQISSIVVMLTGCCLNVNATSYIEETPEIVETTPITADPVKLLQEEVRYTRHWEGEFDDTIQLSYEDAQRLLKIAWAEA